VAARDEAGFEEFLTNGAGTGELANPDRAASVRILDAAGNVVAETPIRGSD
jgi:hypothetical protein